MFTRGNRFIITLIGVAVVLCIIIYGLPKITDSMTKTLTIEYGSIESSDDVTCYIVRNEKIYAPSLSGDVSYKIKEGTKIRKGTKILSISGSNEGNPENQDLINKLGDSLISTDSFRAKINGVLSYKVDGNENIMSVSRLKDITFDEVKDMDNNFENLKKDSVKAGEPIYKIYKNEKWYMLFWVDKETASKYTKGASVAVRFEDGKVNATVSKVRKQKSQYRISLVCNHYYKKLSDTRKIDATVVTSSSSGIIIPNKSIIEEKGKKGVMVKSITGEYSFKPVNILLSDDENSVVSADKFYDEDGKEVITVSVYDEILRNP